MALGYLANNWNISKKKTKKKNRALKFFMLGAQMALDTFHLFWPLKIIDNSAAFTQTVQELELELQFGTSKVFEEIDIL